MISQKKQFFHDNDAKSSDVSFKQILNNPCKMSAPYFSPFGQVEEMRCQFGYSSFIIIG